MAATNKKITDGERDIELLKSVLTKTKIAKEKQRTASLEKERVNLIKKQNYNFEIMLQDWCTDNKLISTAEVERSFSLMNLISTPLRQRLSAENLGHCMRICKFPRSLTENDYQQILSRWLLERNQKVAESIIVYSTKKELLVLVYSFLFVFHMSEENSEDIVLMFLLHAHKSRAYFLIFLKSLKFLKRRYFLKYKSNVLKDS